MAFHDAYCPMWSNEILAELRTNLAELNPPPDVDRLVGNMSKHFPESLITGHAHLIPKMGCHPKDAHVLAAAVQARATHLVTDNLADFPVHSVQPHGLEVNSADEFARQLFYRDPDQVITAIRTQAARFTKPRLTTLELLEQLKHPQRLPEFALEACRWVAQRGW
jgi:hypothetical protein